MSKPSWGNQKIAGEFNKFHPEIKVSASSVLRLKDTHPSLQGLDLGAEKSQKKLNAKQEQQVLQLWRDNPKWANKKIAETLMEQNPGMSISHAVIQRVKAQHPDFLKQSSAQFFDIPEEDVLSPRTLATLSDIFMDELPHEQNLRDEDKGRRATQGGATID